MKFSCVVPSLLSVVSLLGMGSAVAAERGYLQQEILKTLTPAPEEKYGSLSIVDAVKMALENENSVDIIMAKGLREVAAGEYQEKSGAFNPTLNVNANTSQTIQPAAPWIGVELQKLREQEAALPGGSAPALINALSKQEANAEKGNGTFTAMDMKNLSDLKELASGIRQLSAVAMEQNTQRMTVTTSLKQFFRMGVFTQIQGILDRTDPVNYVSAASNGYNPTSLGTIQFNVRVPLLRNSGPDAYQWTVDEKDKKLGYMSKKETFQHTVSSRVLAVAKAYWDYKGAMEKQDILRVSEKLVNKWSESAKSRVTPKGKGDKGGKESGQGVDEVNTLSARLAGEAQDLEEGKAAVYTAKTNLAQALGISVDELNTKGYPGDDYPTNLTADLLDDTFGKRLVELALKERSDLRAAKLTEEQSNTLLTKANKDLLPNLVLDATAGVMGGDVDGSSAGHAIRGFSDNLTYPNWAVIMLFEYPFGNDAAKGVVTQRNMAHMRDSMLLAESHRTVLLSVRNSLNSLKHAIPSVELSKQSIRNYWPSVEGSLEKYNNQREQLNLSALVDLLTLEEKLKLALTRNVDTKNTLAKALLDVRFNTGTLVPKSDNDSFVVTKEAMMTLP
ncbi:MAG: TolC family protein [Magnetococcales bacterium]|nr:TolC family protein [Magnetococcales bacterium]